VLVDAAIVVTENAFRFIEQRRVNVRDRAAVTATVLEATTRSSSRWRSSFWRSFRSLP
jgi:Cu/Ag efflux pump CusA